MPEAQAEDWRGGGLGRFSLLSVLASDERSNAAKRWRKGWEMAASRQTISWVASRSLAMTEILRRAHLHRAVDCFRHIA